MTSGDIPRCDALAMSDERPSRIMFRRRIVWDSVEATDDGEFHRRLEAHFDEVSPDRPGRRDSEPATRDLFAESAEPRLRGAHPDVDAACAEVAAELERRRPGSVFRDWAGTTYDFAGHPELRARWEAALDEAGRRERAKLPPLPVKAGDLVRIGGCVLRISRVDEKRRTVDTRRESADGAPISEVRGVRADALVPLEDPLPPVTDGWPEIPPHLTDGAARARFVRDLHGRVLEEAGGLAGADEDD